MPRRKKNFYKELADNIPIGCESNYTAPQLWAKALEYVEWMDKNPLRDEKIFSSGKKIPVNKIRILSVRSFCLFANISKQTFEIYSKTTDYMKITNQITEIIHMQNMEAAAAGLVSTSIVSKEKWVEDKSTTTANSYTLVIENSSTDAKNEIDILRLRLI
ncbi:MAG: hypothetical protein RL662_764 [Bacteroidota bacterium]|jgi:hypothetical protein